MSQAIFSLIGGEVNPSGKLPISYPKEDNDQQEKESEKAFNDFK